VLSRLAAMGKLRRLKLGQRTSNRYISPMVTPADAPSGAPRHMDPRGGSDTAGLCGLGRPAEARLQTDDWVEHAVITGEWWV
jgi:hypothetical protein